MDEIYGSEGDDYGDEAAKSGEASEAPAESLLKTKKQLKLLKQQADNKARVLIDDLSDDDLAIENTVTARKSSKLPTKQ